MATMDEIERRTREYAEARELLAARVQAMQEEIETIKRRRLRGIKRAVAVAAEAHDRLRAAIEASPELFRRPRTLVIAGVRVGFTKGSGRLVFDDPGRVVALIRRHFPEQADALIRVKEEPVRKALAQLSVAELKRVGVRVEDTGDQVVIKPTDSDVDKLVNALLADAERIEAEAAEAAEVVQ